MDLSTKLIGINLLMVATSVTFEDIISQLTNFFPYPYNRFLFIIILPLIYLYKFYYTTNKDDIDKWIKLYFKKIVLGLILLVVLIVAIYYVREYLITTEPPTDQFVVAISPFYTVYADSLDSNTPSKIQKKIKDDVGHKKKSKFWIPLQ